MPAKTVVRKYAVRTIRSLLSLALVACGSAEGQQDPAELESPVTVPSRATRVEVASILPSTTALRVNLPGEVEGSRDALLAAALGGFVERVLVSAGDEVREGQVLVRVDTATAGTRVAQARVELDAAERELDRSERLAGAATGQELDMARTRVAAARAAIRSAQVQGARAVVRAPFAGTVADVAVEQGEVAAPGAPLVRLVRLEPVHVTLAVPDRDVVSLRPGMEAEVIAGAGGMPAVGRITHVAPAADPQTRAFEVIVELPNEGRRFLPGMIAQVALSAGGDEERIVLPQHVLVTGPDGNGVFVEQEGVATWQPVALGDVVRDQVVIASGVEAGARVIVTGHRELAEGDRVMVVREGSCCAGGRVSFGSAGVAMREEQTSEPSAEPEAP